MTAYGLKPVHDAVEKQAWKRVAVESEANGREHMKNIFTLISN